MGKKISHPLHKLQVNESSMSVTQQNTGQNSLISRFPKKQHQLNKDNGKIVNFTHDQVGSTPPSNNSIDLMTEIMNSGYNDKNKHLNTILMHKLLISGYINDISGYNIINNDVLIRIIDILFNYYYTEKLIFCFISSHCLQAINIDNINNKRWINNKLSFFNDTNGLCIYDKYIKYPHNVLPNQSNANANANANDYYTIFKCGAASNDPSCYAIIANKNQFKSDLNEEKHNYEQSIDSFLWKLPSLPSSTASSGNFVVYSSLNGLISIGGCPENNFLGYSSTNFVYKLSLNDDDNNNNNAWRALRRMNTTRGYASCCIINPGYSESLFVAGGDLNGSVELYSFNTNKWDDISNTNVSRECAGIYYDNSNNLIYLGGGHGAQNKIECYDINKNEWYHIPDTNYNHDFYPILYKSDNNINILYIISPKINCIEYIDLRINNKNRNWSINYDNILHNKIFNVPLSVEFDEFRFL